MTLIPMRIKDGHPRNTIGQLISLAHMSPEAFLNWCERELKKTPGGMDGLTRTETGYTNQPLPEVEK